MSGLMARVVEMVTDRGRATVDDIAAPLLKEGYTRRQIIKAMQNAKTAKRLSCEGPKRGGVHGTWPSAYEPYTGVTLKFSSPMVRAPSSVWDYAQVET